MSHDMAPKEAYAADPHTVFKAQLHNWRKANGTQKAAPQVDNKGKGWAIKLFGSHETFDLIEKTPGNTNEGNIMVEFPSG